VIVVDTSALLAILFEEPSGRTCGEALKSDPDVRVSAGTLSETFIVLAHRGGFQEMAALVEELSIIVEPVDAARAPRVGQAHARWGKGVHPAGLNFGDCFAYALATKLDCPLLFVGEDFSKTDVKVALTGEK
jgi:ribonuclease VapC